MSSEQLLTIIAIVMVANAALILLALVTMRRRGRVDLGGGFELQRRPDSISVSAMAAGGPIEESTATIAGAIDADPASLEEQADDAEQRAAKEESGVVLIDPETGLESATAWRRAVDDEVLRLVRYQRPATVMLVELDGYDRLAEYLGEVAGSRLVVATARTLQAQSRGSDRCARLGRARFGVLLPETDEIRAINFVERVRAECDRWLEAGEVALRLAIGWAILDSAKGATPALQEAEQLLDAERRQRGSSAA